MFNFLRLKQGVFTGIFLGVLSCNVVYAAGHKMPNGELLNDPTRPYNWNKASTPRAKQKHFVLNYILNTSQRKSAIINGKKVTEGESVSGASVVKISQNTVLISVDGKRRTLHLNKGGSIRK